MGYVVWVDDNYHAWDESSRVKAGRFETAEEAIAACKKIVDEFLLNGFKPGMTAEHLYKGYKGFGEDPFIEKENPSDPYVKFSAWDYARQRCEELAAG